LHRQAPEKGFSNFSLNCNGKWKKGKRKIIKTKDKRFPATSIKGHGKPVLSSLNHYPGNNLLNHLLFGLDRHPETLVDKHQKGG